MGFGYDTLQYVCLHRWYGNLIYEKIEADDDNDGNNNDDVSSTSDRKVKTDELQAMKSSVTTQNEGKDIELEEDQEMKLPSECSNPCKDPANHK